MLKRFQFILFVALLFFPILEEKSICKEYVIGVEDIDYYPHYNFTKNQREHKCFAREVFDMFAEKRGVVLIYKPLPNKRLKKNFFEKKIDFIYPDNPKWTPNLRRNSQVYYSRGLVRIMGVTLVPPEKKGMGTDNFNVLGTIEGFTPFHWRNHLSGIRVVEAKTTNALLKMGMEKRIDGVDVEFSVAHHQLVRMKKRGALVLDPDLPHVITPFHLSTIKYPQVIKEFNLFMENNRDMINKMKGTLRISDSMPQAIQQERDYGKP